MCVGAPKGFQGKTEWKDVHDDIGNVHGVRVRALEWSMVAVGGALENLLEELTS